MLSYRYNTIVMRSDNYDTVLRYLMTIKKWTTLNDNYDSDNYDTVIRVWSEWQLRVWVTATISVLATIGSIEFLTLSLQCVDVAQLNRSRLLGIHCKQRPRTLTLQRSVYRHTVRGKYVAPKTSILGSVFRDIGRSKFTARAMAQASPITW